MGNIDVAGTLKITKRFLICSLLIAHCSLGGAFAFKLESQRELGQGDAKNQNIVVKCTMPDGRVSGESCRLRRYAKCSKGKCAGWQEWKNLRNPGKKYGDWRTAAAECCAAKGLR
jgi:hypothetical protein